MSVVRLSESEYELLGSLLSRVSASTDELNRLYRSLAKEDEGVSRDVVRTWFVEIQKLYYMLATGEKAEDVMEGLRTLQCRLEEQLA